MIRTRFFDVKGAKLVLEELDVGSRIIFSPNFVQIMKGKLQMSINHAKNIPIFVKPTLIGSYAVPNQGLLKTWMADSQTFFVTLK